MKHEVLILCWFRSYLEWERRLYDLLRSLPVFLWLCETHLKCSLNSQHLLFPPPYLKWNCNYSSTDHILPIQTPQCWTNAFKQRTVISSDYCAFGFQRWSFLCPVLWWLYFSEDVKLLSSCWRYDCLAKTFVGLRYQFSLLPTIPLTCMWDIAIYKESGIKMTEGCKKKGAARVGWKNSI